MTSSSEVCISASEKCQAECGPFLVSFGDLHKQVNHAKVGYRLTGDELHMLHCVIQAITRKGYRSTLGEILHHKTDYWVRESGLAKSNVSRAFKGLVKKGVVMTVSGPMRRVFHVLSDAFIKDVRSKSVAKPRHLSLVNSVDNSESSYQADNSPVINPITSSYQADNSPVINPITSSYQDDNTRLYIEDFPSTPSLQNSLPPLTTSNLPEPKPVDEKLPLRPHVERLCQFFKAEDVRETREWVERLERLHVAPSIIDSFANYLSHKGARKISPKVRDTEYTLWRCRMEEEPILMAN